MLRQEADPGGSVWVRYPKPWNWDGKQAWKWEGAASCLMEYQVPAADVLRKMEDVQLHNDGRFFFFFFLHFQLKFVTLGDKSALFSFLTFSVFCERPAKMSAHQK